MHSQVVWDAGHNLGNPPKLFEPTHVLRVACRDIAMKNVRCPAPKLDAARGLHSIEDGQNHIQGVVFDLMFDLTVTLSLNCRSFCDSSILGPRKLLPQRIDNVLTGCLDIAPYSTRERWGAADTKEPPLHIIEGTIQPANACSW